MDAVWNATPETCRPMSLSPRRCDSIRTLSVFPRSQLSSSRRRAASTARNATTRSSGGEYTRNTSFVQLVNFERAMDVPAHGGLIRIEREISQTRSSLERVHSGSSLLSQDGHALRPSTVQTMRTADPMGYEADDDDDSI